MKNTKQYVILIAAFLVYPFSIFGQSGEWLPIGATWDYSYWSFGDNERVQLEVSKDTVLSGKNVKKISLQSVRYVEQNNNHVLDTSDFQGVSRLFMYEVQNKVYAWLEDSFYVQMDFSLEVGDTLRYRNNLLQKVDEPRFTELMLDSTSQLVQNQDTLKIQYFSNVSSHSYIFTYPICIEKVGWLGFFTTVNGVAPVTGNLRCYKEAGGFSYQSPHFSGPCDTVIVGKNQPLIEQEAIDIWPNPVTHQLNVKMASSYRMRSVMVFDTNGRIVAGRKGNGRKTRINVEGLPKGVYLLRLYFQNRPPVTKKFVKN